MKIRTLFVASMNSSNTACGKHRNAGAVGKQHGGRDSGSSGLFLKDYENKRAIDPRVRTPLVSLV